jgi:hypothetical protein
MHMLAACVMMCERCELRCSSMASALPVIACCRCWRCSAGRRRRAALPAAGARRRPLAPGATPLPLRLLPATPASAAIYHTYIILAALS